MQRSDALVSIVMPVYRGLPFLSQSIESCLAQTHARFELVIVIDACPAGSGEVAVSYAGTDERVRVISLAENRGISGALNAGYATATGTFFTRLAQDDLFAPNALEKMVDYLTTHPDLGLVYCDSFGINDAGEIIGFLDRPEPENALRFGNKIGLCVLWRRELWEKCGGFDSRFDTAEDYDYWVRLAEFTRFGHLAERLFSFRTHAAMGSRIFSGKQELLAAQIEARMQPTSAGKRRVLARGFFDSAFNFTERGELFSAWHSLVRAFFLRPFHLGVWKLAARLIQHSFARGLRRKNS